MHSIKILENILKCNQNSCLGQIKYSKNILCCRKCGAKYKIIDGILVFNKSIGLRFWDKTKNAKSYAEKYSKYMKNSGTPFGLYTHSSELYSINRLTRRNNISFKDKIIVDCGSGNGRYLAQYPNSYLRIAIDTSFELLKEAKKIDNKIICICSEIEKIPLKDKISNFTVCIRVLQHIKNSKIAIKEMGRITNTNGWLCLLVYNKLNLKNIYKKIRMSKWFLKFKKWPLNYDEYYSLFQIKKLLKPNNLDIKGVSGSGWGLHFYFFDLIKFKSFPLKVQKVVLRIFFSLEKIIGEFSFFSYTLEKVSVLAKKR